MKKDGDRHQMTESPGKKVRRDMVVGNGNGTLRRQETHFVTRGTETRTGRLNETDYLTSASTVTRSKLGSGILHSEKDELTNTKTVVELFSNDDGCSDNRGRGILTVCISSTFGLDDTHRGWSIWKWNFGSTGRLRWRLVRHLWTHPSRLSRLGYRHTLHLRLTTHNDYKHQQTMFDYKTGKGETEDGVPKGLCECIVVTKKKTWQYCGQMTNSTDVVQGLHQISDSYSSFSYCQGVLMSVLFMEFSKTCAPKTFRRPWRHLQGKGGPLVSV